VEDEGDDQGDEERGEDLEDRDGGAAEGGDDEDARGPEEVEGGGARLPAARAEREEAERERDRVLDEEGLAEDERRRRYRAATGTIAPTRATAGAAKPTRSLERSAP